MYAAMRGAAAAAHLSVRLGAAEGKCGVLEHCLGGGAATAAGRALPRGRAALRGVRCATPSAARRADQTKRDAAAKTAAPPAAATAAAAAAAAAEGGARAGGRGAAAGDAGGEGPAAEAAALAAYNAELHELANKSDSKTALKVFNKLRASGIKPDVNTFNALFRACKKSRSMDVSLLESLFVSLKGSHQLQPNQETYHELLSCYGRGGAWAAAEAVFNEMKERGLQPDVKMYCSLLTGYGRSSNIKKAQALFQEMLDAGVQPDVGVYNSLIMACCRCGCWSAAIQAFETLELAHGVTPDIISYNQGILAYGRLNKWKEALALYTNMKEAGVVPNEVTYNNLINTCGRRGEWQIAAGIFGQMQRQGVQPTVVTYNTLITAYADSGELHRCLPVLRKMVDERRCKPNYITFNALLTAFSQDCYDSRPGYDQALDELIEVWERLMVSRCQPNCLTYDAFVGACEAAGLQPTKVVQRLQVMLQGDWRPPQREMVCNLLLCVYERARMCEEAHALYARMEEQGFTPVLVTYNALLGICEYERDWEKALAIHEDMERSRCAPDGVTYNALISTFEECGEWDRATDWLVAARAAGHFDCVLPGGFDIDLHHVRSAGTAQTMLRWHLRQLRTAALIDRQQLPPRIKVITGWGRHSAVTGYSPVKERTVQLLETLHSPFRIPENNPGCLQASGSEVHRWLVTDEILSLMRFLSGNDAWKRNFSPSK